MYQGNALDNGYDQGLSPWADDTATQVRNRARVYRPYGLGPLIREFQAGEPLIYAMELADGTIKIGCTRDLARRRSQLDGELLGFKFGDFDEERAIHRSLAASCIRAREYYSRTPQVVAFINELREPFDLEPLAA